MVPEYRVACRFVSRCTLEFLDAAARRFADDSLGSPRSNGRFLRARIGSHVAADAEADPGVSRLRSLSDMGDARRCREQKENGFFEVRVGIGDGRIGRGQRLAVQHARLGHVDERSRQHSTRLVEVCAEADCTGKIEDFGMNGFVDKLVHRLVREHVMFPDKGTVILHQCCMLPCFATAG